MTVARVEVEIAEAAAAPTTKVRADVVVVEVAVRAVAPGGWSVGFVKMGG
jgi:hypothetical protein